MKKNYSAKKVLQACLLFFMIITTNLFAQVGIGTTTPNASSILDLTSSTQGLLTPRMTTAQRIAIVSPADGLMVYDTDLKSFYHYNSTLTSWGVLNSGFNGRSKFKRIKSVGDLVAEKTAGGDKYLLDTGTLYEINGTINLDYSIELNNAYVVGLDSGEDKLVKASGNLFTGTTGGTIRGLALVASGTGGKVFDINGTGAVGSQTENLILRDCIIANSANVGLIKNFSLVFVSVIQYIGNKNGIIYEDIKKLLINNAGWFGGSSPLGNSGTYETIQGTFDLVQKQGGFSEVTGTSTGFDVSSNPTITGDAVMETVVFTGANTAGYVKPYTPAIYTGYNFNNRWNVRSAGIPTETDLTAVGNINFATATVTTATETAVKLLGTTTSEDLFRFAINGSNRIDYLGSKKRFFRVGGSISFKTPDNNTVFIFYIAKNGVIIPKSKVLVKSNSPTDVITTPIQTLTEMKNGDWIELYVGTETGSSGSVNILSVNLSVN